MLEDDELVGRTGLPFHPSGAEWDWGDVIQSVGVSELNAWLRSLGCMVRFHSNPIRISFHSHHSLDTSLPYKAP